MAFTLHPFNGDRPAPLAATTTVGATFDAEVVAASNQFYYIRIALSLDGGSPVAPKLELNCDLSLYHELSLGSDTVFADPADPTTVYGNAKIKSIAGDVYLIELETDDDGGETWDLRITNQHSAAVKAAWVISQSESETLQPWLDVDASVLAPIEFGTGTVLAKRTRTSAFTLRNYGTDTLTLGADANWPKIAGTGDPFLVERVIVDGGAPLVTDGAGQLAPVAVPPSGVAEVTVRFTAPSVSGEHEETWSVPSDDPNAMSSSLGHRDLVKMTATSGRIELMLTLDASGSMAWAPDGTAGVPVAESRWGLLKDATHAFLDGVKAFGDGAGRIGVAIFPKATVPITDPVPMEGHVLFDAAEIDTTNINSAKTSLGTVTPRGGTPMGAGLAATMGGAPSESGLFLSGADDRNYNARWIGLFSDGEHNSGSPDPDAFFTPSDGVPDFTDPSRLVRVLTLGYGNLGASDVDHARLSNLSLKSAQSGDDTTGWFNAVDTDETGMDLFKKLQSLLSTAFDLTPISDPDVTLTSSAPLAKADFQISRYDRQVSVTVFWSTRDPSRVRAWLVGPNCQVVDLAYADAHPEHVLVGSDERYQMLTLAPAYLHETNVAADGATPQYGTWKLYMEGAHFQSDDTEAAQYIVVSESTIRMETRVDESGPTPRLEVTVTADGVAVTNASITATMAAPAASYDNFLAERPVSPKSLKLAREALGAEGGARALKGLALRYEDEVFAVGRRERRVRVRATDDPGVYAAELPDTRLPGTYELYVVGIGETFDAVGFRRERTLSFQRRLRPDAKHTIVHSVYRRQTVHDRTFAVADLLIRPRDADGNSLFIDPAHDSRFTVHAGRGAVVRGPMTTDYDGTYRVSVIYPELRPARIALEIDDEIFAQDRLVPTGELVFVDRVAAFKPGASAVRDPQQSDPDAERVLGDPLDDPSRDALTLGLGGQLVVGFRRTAVPARAVTVFVRPTRRERAYSVDVELPIRGHRPRWVRLGTSNGTTSTFDLPNRRGLWIASIRITDEATGGAWIARGRPDPTPGVALLGIGVHPTQAFRQAFDATSALKAQLEAWLAGGGFGELTASTRDLLGIEE